MQGGLKQFESYAGQLTPQQRAAVDAWIPRLKSGEGSGATGAAGGAAMGAKIQLVDVMRTGNKERGSLISFYAAGIGVMFLLFSMVGAAGGVLLEEVDSNASSARGSACRESSSANGYSWSRSGPRS
jgi:hypothetical protein